MAETGTQAFWDQYKQASDYYKEAASKKNTPKIPQTLIEETKAAISNVPFKGADQYLTDRENVVRGIAEKNNIRLDDLMKATRQQVANESVGKGGMVSGIKAREKMLSSGEFTGKEAQSAKQFIADTEKFLFPEKIKSSLAKEMTVASRGIDTVGKAVGPAIAVAQGAGAARDILEKVQSGQSVNEAIKNPEVVKGAARGALGYLGADIGAGLGALVPGGIPAKAATEIAGAVGGGYLGTRLADLLTGNPTVDKIITDQYEKARNERMARTKPTAASSVELRQGE